MSDSLRKIKTLESFLVQEMEIFLSMLKEPTQDAYTGDHILRRAVDKSLNDIILACVDLSALPLRKKNRVIPNTYREIILATHEFIGDAALKIAPLTSCRNETIHQYMKLNWENVKTVRNAKDDILSFVAMVVYSASPTADDAPQ